MVKDRLESIGQNLPKSIQEIQMFGSEIRALPIAVHKNLKRKWLSFVDRGFLTVDKIQSIWCWYQNNNYKPNTPNP
jgi:hypothetical protein